MEETGACSICDGIYTNYGNNPWPFADGRACHDCNNRFVTPARILKVSDPRDLMLLTTFAALGHQMVLAGARAATLMSVANERRDET